VHEKAMSLKDRPSPVLSNRSAVLAERSKSPDLFGTRVDKHSMIIKYYSTLVYTIGWYLLRTGTLDHQRARFRTPHQYFLLGSPPHLPLGSTFGVCRQVPTGAYRKTRVARIGSFGVFCAYRHSCIRVCNLNIIFEAVLLKRAIFIRFLNYLPGGSVHRRGTQSI